MKKKIVSIVLTVLLLVSLVPNLAFAAGEFAIAGNEVAYVIGQETKTVDITFNAANNSGIYTAGFEVKFNPAAMTYKEVKSYGEIFTQGELTLGATKVDEGSLYLMYVADAQTRTQNITTNGELITITFEMAETVEAGEYEVQILEDSFSGGVANLAGNPVSPVCTAAKVTVTGGTIPTPPPAGDTAVTFLDETGAEIAKIPFTGTTTINALLGGDAAEADAVNAAIAQTYTEVFAGWTNEDGTAADPAADISASLTVKAKMSAYTVYDAEDILDSEVGITVATTNLSKPNQTTTTNSGKDVLHFISTGASKHGVTLTFPSAFVNYEMIGVSFESNAYNKAANNNARLRLYSDATAAEGVYDLLAPYAYSNTNITGEANGAIDEVFATYATADNGDGTRKNVAKVLFEPWRARGFAATAVICSAEPAAEKAYVDVEYIVFFEKAGAEKYFDYSLAQLPEYTITFLDKDGGEIEATVYEQGKEVALPEAPEVDGFTFIGWSTGVEEADLITENFTATENLTLTATYTEGDSGLSEEDKETLGTFITILKMITSKKNAGGSSSAKVEGIIYNAEDIAANRVVTEGVDIVGGKESKLPGGKTVSELVDGKVRFTNSNKGEASTKVDRLIIKVDDVNLSEYPYYAIKYNTNIQANDVNFNIATKDGKYTASEQKIFIKIAREVGVDASVVGMHNSTYGDTAVATYIYIPIYSNTGATVAEGDYFDIEAVGFFKTEKEANAWVK